MPLGPHYKATTDTAQAVLQREHKRILALECMQDEDPRKMADGTAITYPGLQRPKIIFRNELREEIRKAISGKN